MNSCCHCSSMRLLKSGTVKDHVFWIKACSVKNPVVLSPEFWSWKFWSPGPKFSLEKWSPRTHFFGKSGLPLEIWSGSCKLETVSGTFNTCKEVFSLSTVPTVPHILVLIWSLSLTGWPPLPHTKSGTSTPVYHCMHAILLSRVIVHTLRPSAIIYSQFASVT